MSRRLALVGAAKPDAEGEALRALAVALAPLLRDLLASEAHQSALVDVLASVPGPRRSVMGACRSGAIEGAARVGRRWLAPRSAVDAWLRSQRPRALPTAKEGDGDELERLRARLARPARRRSA